MALFNEWQAQRQQRQQELLNRQQQVSEDLALWRENRVNMGREVRQSLSDCHQEIRVQTQDFLSNCRDRRYQDSQVLMQSLDEFVNALAAETSQFIRDAAAARSTMAIAQTKSLQDFHHDLNLCVRQFCQECRDRRLDMKAELTEYLHRFIEQLSADVADYLEELDFQQQQVAQELQETFRVDRQQRSQTMQGLYNHFANLRLQRQQEIVTLQEEMWRNVKEYRLNLFNQVWGYIPAPTTPKTSPPSSPAIGSAPVNPVASAVTPTAAPPKAVTPAPAPPAPAPPAPTPPAAVTPQASPTQTSQTPDAMMQQAVYDYLKQVKSARIKDIEAQFKITRIQTVDILRALITQGLVMQNNRDYMIVSK